MAQQTLKSFLSSEELTYANLKALSRKYKWINTLNGTETRIIINSADDFDLIMNRYKSDRLNHIIVER